jgi:protein-L-isoaspartate(D-aspartate) O-methyltransferase
MVDVDLQSAREKMLHRQLVQRGIHDSRVLAAMAKVPRERFVDAEQRRSAYADSALPIDCGQTISQPYIVALMTEALKLTGQETVLEIGTGSGYQTAILAELANDVVTIERYRTLSASAADRLESLGYHNITPLVGDGTLGWPDRAPFDRIMVTAMAARCPPSLLAQLAEGGILVIPIGDRDGQMLQAIRKVDGAPRSTDLSSCRFVPLVGMEGWED